MTEIGSILFVVSNETTGDPMTLATALLRAPHVGVRDLKAHLSERMKTKKPLIVTEHGEPKQVLIPYEAIVEIAEILDELNDKELVKAVRLSRKSAEEGLPGIPVETLFKKISEAKRRS